MNALTFPQKILAIFILVVSCFISTPMQAQTIQIDSLFTTDGEIFPFGTNDTIFGLSISGHVTLSSDTSLVRVILTDNSGNEWMVYEAYPMIVEDTAITITNQCDETCYLTGIIPESLKIQLYYGQITISEIHGDTVFKENLEQLHQSSLENRELMKISMINSYLEDNKMLWRAAHTIFSAKTYQEKKSLFGEKYALFGYDFYNGGIYSPYRILNPAPVVSNLVEDFDWRKRHGSNDPDKANFYFDGDPDTYIEEECDNQSFQLDEHGNGWMTAVKCQVVHYHNTSDLCKPHCKKTCYIYSCLGALEALTNLYYIRTDAGLDMAEQQIVDCGGEDISCDPGYIDDVSEYLQATGVIDESHYPWEDHQNTSCNYSNIAQGAYQVKIGDYKGVNKSQIDTIKKAIITQGPLVAVMKYDNSDEGLHSMALVGFGTVHLNDVYHNKGGGDIQVTDTDDPNIGKIYWIFKQSYSPEFGDGGYVFHLQDQFDPPHNILQELNKYLPPFEGVPSEFNDTRKCYDKDSDGYCFWGIGAREGCDNCQDCPEEEELEDCDDSNPRIGPYATDYSETPIAPKMEVSLYKEWQCNKVVENGEFFYVENACFLDGQILEFKITNDGTAQLNLSPVGNVVSLSGPDESDFLIENQNQPARKIKFNTQSSFKITYTGNLSETKTVLVTIGVFEDDMPDYQFALILNGCQTATGIDQKYGIINWDDPFKLVNKDIKINSGGILTITGNVAFSSGADIFVDRGGKLIINGGKLTASCDNLWNGIQVWGYKDKSQYDPAFPPGKVELSSNAVIENARTAIATIKSDNGVNDNNYSGGIIWCKDATFSNNIYGLRFYYYRNFYPNKPNYEISNLSYIIKSTFITNGILPEAGARPIAFIRMDDVVGIDLRGNQFMNTSGEEFDWSKRGIGIESHNAAFFMKEFCLNSSIPCNLSKRNYFYNLYYGVKAYGQGRENHAITVLQSDFHLNQYGMFVSIMNNARIDLNNFTVPERSPNDERPLYGLYIEYSSGYSIQENSFQGYGNGQDDNIGMYISNSGGQPNQVYKNDFSDLEYGMVAYGQNRNETGEGLCLICNNFDLCTNDIHVIPETGLPHKLWLQGRNQGIATNQHSGASLTSPAGNTFTDKLIYPQTFNYFNHDDCNMINYYHHRTAPPGIIVIPNPRSEAMVHLSEINENYQENIACPSNYGGGGINLSMEKSLIHSENEQISIYSDSIQTLKDGGDTYTLNLDVYTSTPDEAYKLRQQLLDESPYLSDTVMKSSIYMENVLPNEMLRDVLVANPQSAKSTEILDKIEGRMDPMPDEMMNEILQGRNIDGDLEILEAKMAKHKTAKYESLYKLESSYKLDTLDFQGSMDSLIGLWSEETEPEFQYKLALLYLYKNDSINCSNTMNMIPQSTDLSIEQMLDYEDYSSLIEILWSLEKDNSGFDSLKTEQLTEFTLRDSKPGILARNLLVANGIIDYIEPIYLSDNLKSSLIIPDKYVNTKQQDQRLNVFPNPAKDYIIISYDLEGRPGKSSIIINSINGKPCYEKFLTGTRNQFVLSLSKFSSGIYNILLKYNGEIMETSKFVISK